MPMYDTDTEGFELEFSPLPAGTYMCGVTEKEDRKSSTGKDMVVVSSKVVDGEYADRRLPDRYFVVQGGGLGFFKRFCDAAKIPYEYDKEKGKFKFDSDDIPGAEFKAVVGQEPTKKENVETGEMEETGRLRNTIEQYLTA